MIIRPLRKVLLSKSRATIHAAGALLFFALSFLSGASAQDAARSAPNQSENNAEPALRRGTNEFGGWAGFSPFSFRLKGTSEDRKLFLLNLQYARTLFSTTPVTVKYTAEIVPVALEIQPTQFYVVGGETLVNPSGTIYGAGASPVGFQGNVGRKSVQPFANGSRLLPPTLKRFTIFPCGLKTAKVPPALMKMRCPSGETASGPLMGGTSSRMATFSSAQAIKANSSRQNVKQRRDGGGKQDVDM